MTTTTKAFADLTAEATRLMARLHVPGVAVGVLHDGAEHAAGLGVTNVENPLPVDAGTLFQIGSITKTITGTAALRLAEAGRLDLEAPVRAWVPELELADEAVAAQVSLRHLLTHTGGWAGDYFDDSGPGDEALARIVGRLGRLPQLTPLGAVWAYNNAGFYVAGRAIEAATGQTYEAAARDLVLDPLGMDHSFFFAAEAITYRVAAGHEAVYERAAGGGPAQPKVARPWGMARSGNPVGGLVSSVRDQLRYARFHLGDGAAPGGQRLLQPAMLARMHTPTVPAANGEQFGLAWFIREVNGERVLRHTGGTNGQTAVMQLVPGRQFALVALTNSDRGDELHRALARLAFERFLGWAEPEPQPVAASPAQLGEYLGRYTAQMADRLLYFDNDQLMLQVVPKGGFPTPDAPASEPPPPVRAALCGPDCLLVLDEPMQAVRGEFLRDAAGRVQWLRISGRLHRKADGANE